MLTSKKVVFENLLPIIFDLILWARPISITYLRVICTLNFFSINSDATQENETKFNPTVESAHSFYMSTKKTYNQIGFIKTIILHVFRFK